MLTSKAAKDTVLTSMLSEAAKGKNSKDTMLLRKDTKGTKGAKAKEERLSVWDRRVGSAVASLALGVSLTVRLCA